MSANPAASTAGWIPLQPGDQVFQIGKDIYALESNSRNGADAARVFERGGVYYRLDVSANLRQEVITGVLHQGEHFAAAHLPGFKKH